ncbi:MAG: DUF167 domain-containing protein, partial [Gammaproteobacteria bacterium]|nr:DUF167 domain-containing protein [Gammaproteobacteria bacterium]
AGWYGDNLRIRVSAAPRRGKANAAAEKLVALALGLPKQAVRIVSGKTTARKLIETEGLSKSDIIRRLEPQLRE